MTSGLQSGVFARTGAVLPGSNRPRLLLAAPYFRPAYYGGVVQVYHQLLTRLKSVESFIVCQRLGGNPEEMERFDRAALLECGYQVLRIERYELIFGAQASLVERLGDTARFLLRTRAEWRKAVREIRPDVIVCGATGIAGWLMEHLPEPIPFINYIHGEELGEAGKSRFFRRFLFQRQLVIIRKAALNISVSRYTASKAIALTGISAARIALLPNFVDEDRFSPPSDREALRRQLGWHDKKVILTLSRLTPRKGIDQSIRALVELRREGKLTPEWIHVVAGSGEQEGELRALTASLGVGETTRFEGFVPDERVPHYYGAADIFLLPNRDLMGNTEGFGIVFLEAGACGTPVIGGIAGGTADAIREGVTGFRVNSEDSAEIGRAVLELVNDEELRHRMGVAAAEIVRREHRVETAVSSFENLLLDVIRPEKLQKNA